MLNSFTQYRSSGPGFGAIGHFFLQWWGRGRGPVGQMPHQSMVLKSALVRLIILSPDSPKPVSYSGDRGAGRLYFRNYNLS